MVWYFIGVYIINRTLHEHVEMQNFCSHVEKYFKSEHMQPCNILYLLNIFLFQNNVS